LLLINTGEYKYWIVVNKCLIINKEHFKSWILGKKLLVFMKVDLEYAELLTIKDVELLVIGIQK
jgi:hypothetical protein